MKLYERMRAHFDPELRARMQRASELAQESERRKALADHEQEVGALASNPLIQDVRKSILGWSATVMPQENMDAAACFWFKRGLEQAVKVLDDRVSPSAEE